MKSGIEGKGRACRTGTGGITLLETTILAMSILAFSGVALAALPEKGAPVFAVSPPGVLSCDTPSNGAAARNPAPALPHVDAASTSYLIGMHPSRTSPGGEVALYRVCPKDAGGSASESANAGGSCRLVFESMAQEHPLPATLSATSGIPVIRPDESCRTE